MGSIAELKRMAIEQLLEQEPFMLVVVNPLTPGVQLPDYLVDASQPVPLHIGLRMAVEIPDLRIDDEGITGTLSFNRLPFHCVLPWPCLMQVSVDDEHLVWVVPPDDGEPPAADDDDDDDGDGPKKPHLRLV